MEITGEHIGFQILHRLERPVLATTPIIVEIDTLFNDRKRQGVVHIIVRLQFLVKTVCFRILRFEVLRTSHQSGHSCNKERSYIFIEFAFHNTLFLE